MFDLFDTTEPPPRFTFSALLALVASVAAAVWETMILWDVVNTSSAYLILALFVAAIGIAPAAGIAGALCAIAMYFHQHRWAYIGLGIMGLPYAALVVYLVVAAITS